MPPVDFEPEIATKEVGVQKDLPLHFITTTLITLKMCEVKIADCQLYQKACHLWLNLIPVTFIRADQEELVFNETVIIHLITKLLLIWKG